MAEVSRVSGPGGPDEPKKDKSVRDAEKFKELMKIQKIDEVDEEKKKKRKRPEEAEEDVKAAQGASAQAQGAPLEPSPFVPTKGKVSGALKADAAATPAPPAPSEAPPPAHAEEGEFWEGETYMQTFPAPKAEKSAAPPPIQIETAVPPYPKSHEGPPEGAKEAVKPIAPLTTGKSKKAEPRAPKIPAEEKTSHQRESSSVKKEEKTSYFEHAKKGSKAEKRPEEMVQEAEATSSVSPEKTPASHKAKKEKKIEEIAPQTGQAPQEMPLPQAEAAAAPGPLPSYAYLHPQVLDIFERMVGVITVMSNARLTETTISLTAPQFSSSVFYGAQIIIQEYSTAPKAFNVQLIANPQAVKLFQANADDLMAAFQTGKYNFRINRLEASLATDRPLIRRKEGAAGEGKEKDKGK